MEILKVAGLYKNYPAFQLKDVSFSLQEGQITGFIGRNGAGKSTTLKSLLNIIHAEYEEISFFGMNIKDAEFEIKQQIGFVSGSVDYYPRKRLKSITDITKGFYRNWDETKYRKYMDIFALDEKKMPSELSSGMKVKYALTLAMSHNAKLLILDEPTSGLDPVSRDELLNCFMDLAEKGVSIFFSTHIISDLEKCADKILYIRKGRLSAQGTIADFLHNYQIVELPRNQKEDELKSIAVGYRRMKERNSFLIPIDAKLPTGVEGRKGELEEIIIHLENDEKDGAEHER